MDGLRSKARRSSRTGLRAVLLASTMIVSAANLATAADIRDVGTLGGTQSFLSDAGNSLSADGSTVVGGSQLAANAGYHAFKWSAGVMTDLGTLGGTFSSAYGVSADGSVVVGYGFLAGNTAQHAFRWTDGTGMVDLGTLGGISSTAYATSGNGSVIAGSSYITGNAAIHAFRWSGGTMTDLGTLGGNNSEATGVSTDGSVIVGDADTASGGTRAFRWTGGVMTDLGTLAGSNFSIARAVSGDGTTVVGVSVIAGGEFRAVRWNGGAITDLGTFGGTQTEAFAVSANGAVVVGYSLTAGNAASLAYRWTAATGMQSVASLLTAAGVDITGWSLDRANGVSADGNVITGRDATKVWIARLSSTGTGIIGTDEAARSFASLGALGQTGNAAIGASLGTMSQYATQIQNGGGDPNSRFSVFATGAYDTDPTASGSLGLTMKLGSNMIAGGLIEADYIKTNMSTNGGAKMSGGGGGLFIASIPDTGLQWLALASALTIKGDITRGYLNGNTPSSSTGNTRGSGFGASARVGWAFDAMNGIKITPFASYTLTSIKFDGYTETDGAFPAQFDDFTDRAQTARLGSDIRYTFAPGKWMWGSLAWAHRVDGGKTAEISGTLIGLFPIGTTGVAFAKDWAEATAGVRLPFGTRGGTMTASVTASVPEKQATTFLARLGIAQAF